jgi:hypothetical protein
MVLSFWLIVCDNLFISRQQQFVYVSGDESVKSSKEIAPVKIVNGGLSGACHVFDFQAYAKWMEIDFFFFKYFHSGSCSGIGQDT